MASEITIIHKTNKVELSSLAMGDYFLTDNNSLGRIVEVDTYGGRKRIMWFNHGTISPELSNGRLLAVVTPVDLNIEAITKCVS